jgi:4'-phosphopantetheinyl transferase
MDVIGDHPGKRFAESRCALKLTQEDVHVWHVSLDAALEALYPAQRVLDHSERDRALSFAHRSDRRKFELTRGALRLLLGAYSGSPPGDLSFGYGIRGKPKLVWPSSDIQFSVARSSYVALLAFRRKLRVGVDLEKIRPEPTYESLARRVFTPTEWDRIRKAPEEARMHRFFECWVRKEALVKGAGLGLFETVSQVDASTERVELSDRTWVLQDIDIGPRYAAAVACESRPAKVKCFHYIEWLRRSYFMFAGTRAD